MKIKSLILLVIAGQTIAAQPTMTVSATGNYLSPFWMASNILVDSNVNVYNMDQNGLNLTQPKTTQIGYFQANDIFSEQQLFLYLEVHGSI